MRQLDEERCSINLIERIICPVYPSQPGRGSPPPRNSAERYKLLRKKTAAVEICAHHASTATPTQSQHAQLRCSSILAAPSC